MKYLYRSNSSGTYYFRYCYPPFLRKVLNKRELKLSLRTKEFERARIKASILSYRIYLLKQVLSMKLDESNLDTITKRMIADMALST